LKPGNFADVSISKVLHFVQSAGLLSVYTECLAKDQKWLKSMGPCGAHNTLFYSSLLYFTPAFYSLVQWRKGLTKYTDNFQFYHNLYFVLKLC